MTQPGWNQQSPWQQRPGPAQPSAWSYGQYQPPTQHAGAPRPVAPGPNQPQYAPQPAPQWGAPGTAPYAPPPRRGGSARWVLGGVLAIVVIGFAALIISNLVGGSSTTYQNDDYSVPPPDLNPPALPVTKSLDEAKQWTTANVFYDQTVAQPVRCDNTRIDDAADASDAELQKHLDGLTECLMRVWAPVLEKSGYVAVRPTVTIYGKTIDTGCGELDGINAVYCGADQQVYYSRDLFSILPEVDDKSSVVIDFVLAHEFGHALQGRTGILYARILLQQNADSKPAALELNRRLETQADCFSGMYQRATARSTGLAQADVTTIKQSLRAVGDPDNRDGDHGKADNREFWGLTGFATDQVGKCNTFVAPSDQVR